MRELAVESANGTLSSGDKDNLQTEFASLQNEVSRVAQSTKFNNVSLLDSNASAFTFQVGAGTATSDQLTISTVDLQASTISVDSGSIDITGSSNGNSNALAAITNIDSALNTINTVRAVFGAGLNRISNAVSNLQTSITNQSAAKSRIMDADFAAETANLTRAQILQQAGTAMLAQANAIPNQVLSLLR
jgi:flagellin